MYLVCILIYGSIYLYSYPSTHGISGLAAGRASEQFEVRLEMTMKWTQRYTWRRVSCEVRDALGGCDRASLMMRWEAVFEWTNRCTASPWLSEFGDELGGHDRATLEEYLEALDRRCTGCWDCIYHLVNSQLWECDEVTLPLSSLMESSLVTVDLVRSNTESWDNIQGSNRSCENGGKTDNLW